MDMIDLTDKQALMVFNALRHPLILSGAGEKNTARSLERKCWGYVEDGAGLEKIFRLSQAGENAALHRGFHRLQTVKQFSTGRANVERKATR